MEGPPELELPVPAQVWVADIPSSLERGNLAGPPPDIFTISRRGIGRRISRLEPLYLGEGLLPTSELAQAEHDPLEIFILAPSRLRGRLLAQPRRYQARARLRWPCRWKARPASKAAS